MLQSHMNMGLNVGITQSQLGEIVNIIAQYIGWEQAKIAKTIFILK